MIRHNFIDLTVEEIARGILDTAAADTEWICRSAVIRGRRPSGTGQIAVQVNAQCGAVGDAEHVMPRIHGEWIIDLHRTAPGRPQLDGGTAAEAKFHAVVLTEQPNPSAWHGRRLDPSSDAEGIAPAHEAVVHDHETGGAVECGRVVIRFKTIEVRRTRTGSAEGRAGVSAIQAGARAQIRSGRPTGLVQPPITDRRGGQDRGAIVGGNYVGGTEPNAIRPSGPGAIIKVYVEPVGADCG